MIVLNDVSPGNLYETTIVTVVSAVILAGAVIVATLFVNVAGPTSVGVPPVVNVADTLNVEAVAIPTSVFVIVNTGAVTVVPTALRYDVCEEANVNSGLRGSPAAIFLILPSVAIVLV